MPRFSKFSRSKSISNASIVSSSLLDFLAPAVFQSRNYTQCSSVRLGSERNYWPSNSDTRTEDTFYSALSQASLCDAHRQEPTIEYLPYNSRHDDRTSLRSTSGKYLQHERPSKASCRASSPLTAKDELSVGDRRKFKKVSSSTEQDRSRSSRGKTIRHTAEDGYGKQPRAAASTHHRGLTLRDHRFLSDIHNSRYPERWPIPRQTCISYLQKTGFDIHRVQTPNSSTQYHTSSINFNSKQRRFAESSHLPETFFDDVHKLSGPGKAQGKSNRRHVRDQIISISTRPTTKLRKTSSENLLFQDAHAQTAPEVSEQMKLLTSVRELEYKLGNARKDLARSLAIKPTSSESEIVSQTTKSRPAVVLTKEDYKNLVDLYFYSHNSRFSPESTDESPTPLLLDDYSFALSSDFSSNTNQTETVNEDEEYESPLKQIEEMLKQRQLREIAVMQVFVDLLLDDYSSNRALYEAYKQLPDPGVAYLPKGIIRLFLQRMSTPWTLSEKSMLRYLSLIDDMQRAKIPIVVSEWSSAVYLAGRAFTRVTDQEVKNAFKIWQTMEHEAGVKASHVTFNILFDIAVRSGRFALGETILKEMHSRNLRLNRLGRVSLMYYHGLRKDGDGVRKAYRDFVEAGEIVDTLVLNCVIASLLNAQEPQAAEQVYARMKNMQSRLRKGFDREGDEVLYQRYPDPGTNTIEQEMASNYLGRVLEKTPRLQKLLPENHRDLQGRMPLTPDHITFRSMIAYHSTTSGDLDRLTVLLQDMTEFFQLPLQTITFQLLFKGFTIHGPINGPNTVWSIKRLDMCWNACRAAIKDTQTKAYTRSVTQDVSDDENIVDDDSPGLELILPSITQIKATPQHASLPNSDLPLSRPPPRRLSGWAEFVLDLAAFPRERLKRLERFHATMFDAEDMKKPHEKPGPHTYESPFFQSTAYTAPEPRLDTEEGEYELPTSSDTGLLQTRSSQSESRPDENEAADDLENIDAKPHQVAATRALVCWLLRAYTRISKSRVKVEEVWGQVRKLYKPRDATERESVVRVLRRCLKDCDMERGN